MENWWKWNFKSEEERRKGEVKEKVRKINGM